MNNDEGDPLPEWFGRPIGDISKQLGIADPRYAQATRIVMANRPSPSLVQRHLKIGYHRALAMIVAMEREGLVSPPDHVNCRTILVRHHHDCIESDLADSTLQHRSPSERLEPDPTGESGK